MTPEEEAQSFIESSGLAPRTADDEADAFIRSSGLSPDAEADSFISSMQKESVAPVYTNEFGTGIGLTDVLGSYTKYAKKFFESAPGVSQVNRAVKALPEKIAGLPETFPSLPPSLTGGLAAATEALVPAPEILAEPTQVAAMVAIPYAGKLAASGISRSLAVAAEKMPALRSAVEFLLKRRGAQAKVPIAAEPAPVAPVAEPIRPEGELVATTKAKPTAPWQMPEKMSPAPQIAIPKAKQQGLEFMYEPKKPGELAAGEQAAMDLTKKAEPAIADVTIERAKIAQDRKDFTSRLAEIQQEKANIAQAAGQAGTTARDLPILGWMEERGQVIHAPKGSYYYEEAQSLLHQAKMDPALQARARKFIRVGGKDAPGQSSPDSIAQAYNADMGTTGTPDALTANEFMAGLKGDVQGFGKPLPAYGPEAKMLEALQNEEKAYNAALQVLDAGEKWVPKKPRTPKVKEMGLTPEEVARANAEIERKLAAAKNREIRPGAQETLPTIEPTGTGTAKVTSESGTTRLLASRDIAEMDALEAAVKAGQKKIPGMPMAARAAPVEALKDAGLEAYGKPLLNAEVQSINLPYQSEVRMWGTLKKHNIKPGSGEEALAYDFMDGKVTKDIANQAAKEGVNVEGARSAAQELALEGEAYANLAEIPAARRIENYVTHLKERKAAGEVVSGEAEALLELRKRMGSRSAFLEKHRTGGAGDIKRLSEVLPLYYRSVTRDVYLDRPLREIAVRASRLPWDSTNLDTRNMLYDWMRRINAGPHSTERALGVPVRAMATKANQIGKALSGGKIDVYRDFLELPQEQQWSHALRTGKMLQMWHFLGGNAMTGVKMLMDLAPATAKINPYWMGRGFVNALKVLATRDRGITAKVAKWGVTPDAQLAGSWKDSGLEAISQGRLTHMETGVKAAKGKAERVGAFFMQRADIFTKMVTYLGAKAKYLNKSPGQLRAAHDYALGIVQESQPLFLKSTTPALLQHPLGRATLMFGQPSLKTLAIQRRMVLHLNTPEGRGEAAIYVPIVTGLMAAGNALGIPSIARELLPVMPTKVDGKWTVRPGYVLQSLTNTAKLGAALLLAGEGKDIPWRIGARAAKEIARTPIPKFGLNIATAVGLKGTTLGNIMGVRHAPTGIMGRLRALGGSAITEPKRPSEAFKYAYR